MDSDRKSIGLTPETQAMLAKIEARDWFPEKEDIAHFCMAYAIRAKVPEGTTTGVETRWAAGNFDKTGEIALLLAEIYPTCQTPVRLMEHLVNEGLRLVAARLSSDAVGPPDLMS